MTEETVGYMMVFPEGRFSEEDYDGAALEHVCPKCHSPHICVHPESKPQHWTRGLVVDCMTCRHSLSDSEYGWHCTNVHDALVDAETRL